MKVVHVIPSISAESSGPSYYMMRLKDALEQDGVDVSLHTLEQYPRRWSVIPNFGRSPEMYAALKNEIKNGVDIVHNNSLWMMPNVYPYWAAKNSSVKVVTSPHGTLSKWALDHGKFKKKVFGTLVQYPALKRTDMWHATCEKEYGEIRAAGYRQPVAIIPIGMDLPDVDHAEWTAHDGHKRKLVFFGRVHKVKAIDNLILAWAQVADAFSGWELNIAGPDGGARGELEALIGERNIPRVSFVGELNGKAKYEFLASADLCALPSHTENFGVTVAESLACGTPVIASQGTPWKGLVENKAGWWIPIGVEPLAKQLRVALKLASDELRQIGANGRKWMQKDFDWNAIGSKMKLAYEWLLGKADKPNWIREQ